MSKHRNNISCINIFVNQGYFPVSFSSCTMTQKVRINMMKDVKL